VEPLVVAVMILSLMVGLGTAWYTYTLSRKVARAEADVLRKLRRELSNLETKVAEVEGEVARLKEGVGKLENYSSELSKLRDTLERCREEIEELEEVVAKLRNRVATLEDLNLRKLKEVEGGCRPGGERGGA